MHATNRLDWSLGHERDHGTTSRLGHCDISPLYIQHRLPPISSACIITVNDPTRARSPFSSYTTMYYRKVAKLYQQTTCMYLSKSRVLQRNAELIPRPLSGSRSTRDQGTSSSVKVSHLSRRLKYSMDAYRLHCDRTNVINARFSRMCNKGEKLGISLRMRIN